MITTSLSARTMISTNLLLVSALLSGAYAAIGPVANMQIVNANIAPDGFTRAYAPLSLRPFTLDNPISALLLLVEHFQVHSLEATRYTSSLNKVVLLSFIFFSFQGDRFMINVIDRLTDNTMLRSTSIVSSLFVLMCCLVSLTTVIIALAWSISEGNLLG